jgi:hypothetical protein
MLEFPERFKDRSGHFVICLTGGLWSDGLRKPGFYRARAECLEENNDQRFGHP